MIKQRFPRQDINYVFSSFKMSYFYYLISLNAVSFNFKFCCIQKVSSLHMYTLYNFLFRRVKLNVEFNFIIFSILYIMRHCFLYSKYIIKRLMCFYWYIYWYYKSIKNKSVEKEDDLKSMFLCPCVFDVDFKANSSTNSSKINLLIGMGLCTLHNLLFILIELVKVITLV